jgi:DNA mismatch endonuclease, patch repair protein
VKERPEDRSRIMRAVKGHDTSAELLVRKIVKRLGYRRFGVNRRDLPGSPDLVFSRKRAVIFVHGCFWHGHRCKRGNRVPKQNRTYWIGKIARNKARDKVTRAALRLAGWDVLVIWECGLKRPSVINESIRNFLTKSSAPRDSSSRNGRRARREFSA